MADYITQRKPTFLKVILNKLGLIGLHTRVNCWFCNQDSYILPGTKNTAEHWFCHLCENTNARDKNGDIIDPSPFQVIDKSYRDIPPSDDTRSNTNRRALCTTCQDKQAVVYQMMSDYIPDESDPSYEEKCATADARQAELHQLYKVCPSCQSLIDQVVAEQKEILKHQSIDRMVFTTLNENNFDKRPTRQQYVFKGIMWIITHTLTLVFVYYVILHPPSTNNNTITSWSLHSLTNYVERLDLHPDSWRGFLTVKSIQNMIEYKIETLKGFIGCLFTTDTDCEWDLNGSLVYFILLNFVSLKSIDWNRGIKPIAYEKIKNLGFYKHLQMFLFCLRFLLLWVVFIGLDEKIILLITSVYIITLYYSDRLINPSQGITKPVQNSFLIEDQAELEPMDCSEDMELSVADEPKDEIDTITDRLRGL
ncbi:Ima1 N-terminal domain-containing protein [Pilaira anomala]|nr:Ima1 N-terminal domain-containing protein [Pilaira anomala]